MKSALSDDYGQLHKKKRRSYDRRFFHGAMGRREAAYSGLARADGAKKSSLGFALWD
jgi:hypothetical protein